MNAIDVGCWTLESLSGQKADNIKRVSWGDILKETAVVAPFIALTVDESAQVRLLNEELLLLGGIFPALEHPVHRQMVAHVSCGLKSKLEDLHVPHSIVVELWAPQLLLSIDSSGVV